MITYYFLNFLLQILTFVLSVFDIIFQLLPDVAYDISAGAGYVFGNMWLLNDLLPISDLFIIATMAVTFKTILFGFKAVLFLMGFFGIVKRTFLTFRS